LSLEVTKALTPLLDFDFSCGKGEMGANSRQHSFRSSKKDISEAEKLEFDRDNVIFALGNLLKGKAANAMHFIEVGCCSTLGQLILREESTVD